MKDLITAGRCFYGIGIAGIGILQFIYADFRSVVVPPGWPLWLHTSALAYGAGAALITSGSFIVLGKEIKNIAFIIATLFFVLFLTFQVPFMLFIQPNSPRHLGLWTDPLKELAFCGGGLILAGSFDNNKKEIWMLTGGIFFSIMLIAFGLDHFYYTEFVASLVPSWIPAPIFWAYFGAVCLMGSGIAILFKIYIREIAFLAGIMLLLWFAMLHIPRAIADPHSGQGNEIASVFEALAYSGVAFVLAGFYKRKKLR